MTDALSAIPAAVLRTLSDKLYEKRKIAAYEIEGIVKQLTAAGDHDRINPVINLLTHEFTYSQANIIKKRTKTADLIDSDVNMVGNDQFWELRSIWGFLVEINGKTGDRFGALLGGLIGMAAVAVALSSEAAQHLEQILPPVINSFSDQDSRVRYYACEALYNIAKIVRGKFIFHFNNIFDALCKLSADSDPNVQSAAHLLDRLVKDIVTESDQFSIDEFIPLLRERMNVLNPYVRQFLVGWITVLDSVPEIDMLAFIPDFLDGLFNMLSDSSHEIRKQADSALSEFLQEIKNSSSVDYGRMAEILVQRAASPDEFTRWTAVTWINEFVKLGGDQFLPYYPDILGAILPCIADKEEKIRVVAHETNEELRAIQADPAQGFDVGAILSVVTRMLSSEHEATRIGSLHWISTLLNRHRPEVLSFLNDIFNTLLKSLSDPSDQVVLLVLEVHAAIAKDQHNFCQLLVLLVHKFQTDYALLERRGALIVRRLCVLLESERVYRELSKILEGEADLNFASTMVEALNLILLTSSELSGLRDLLKLTLVNAAGKDLFLSLYASWRHSVIAIISLCLLAQAYQHASSVIQCLTEQDVHVRFLVQLDKLIHLLETPIFAYLRLQLLEPGRYIWLLKALYGFLMLLPQRSTAFKILDTLLKTIPSYSLSKKDQIKQRTQNGYMSSGLQVVEDGNMNDDDDDDSIRCNNNGINFSSWLQRFEQMQQQHRLHLKSQARIRNISINSKEVKEVRIVEPKGTSTAGELSRPPSRSSRKSPVSPFLCSFISPPPVKKKDATRMLELFVTPEVALCGYVIFIENHRVNDER
ncbi:protein VAC14 homolog [Rutidosis leptorrhynchoides]|uniref:protein VAC14 homolog n=1 Tax=Rutidosis leptorrhynchoides TaxID=125765 RepID=UPI003A996395